MNRIKLETVHRMPEVGNFPRLSELLAEAELENLLVRLVQRLHVEVLEDQKVLEISMRRHRSGRGAALAPTPPPRSADCREASEIEPEDRQHRRRPRTCPSTVSRTHTYSSGVSSPHSEERAVAAHCEMNTKSRAQLDSRLSNDKGRLGIRHKGVFYLARVSYSPRSAVLVVSTVNVATAARMTTREQCSSIQAEKLVRQLESHELTCEELVRQELRRLLP